MDKIIGKSVKEITKHGEKLAPIKQIKLKVKFASAQKNLKKKEMAKKMK